VAENGSRSSTIMNLRQRTAHVSSPTELPAAAPLLDPGRLDHTAAEVRREPFAFLVAPAQLPLPALDALERDFPRYAGAGFFPHATADCGPSINALVEALTAPAFADAIGSRLGIERLSRYPNLVTICRSLSSRHGTVHTDSRSKVVTALLYLNREWATSGGGCLRLLARVDDIDSLVTPEIKPLYGTLVAFKRSENSFHGHLPFEGERRVIQVAWLTSEEEKRRKTRRGRLSRAVKWLAGALDRRFGRRR
jgi:hypothetical protein